jgi:hypothetical protein
VESPWKGLSGMDAARAAMCQGWPFAACLWNGDGANEPGAKRRAGWRGKRFWLLLSRLTKVTRPAGRNRSFAPEASSEVAWTLRVEKASPFSTLRPSNVDASAVWAVEMA